MTKKMRSLLVLAVTLALAATTVVAQEGRAGRYTMHKSDDGFVRLDTETGAVSLCQKTGGGWGCRAMADAGDTSPNSEVARLKKENANLKAEIKRLDELLGLRGNRDKAARHSRNFSLPTEKEVDGALDYFERMLKKFQDRLKRLEKKSQESPERQL